MSKVLIGVCGSIASYKALDIIRELQKKNINPQAILTSAAAKFVSPLTFQTITKLPVLTNQFRLSPDSKINHTEITKSADVLLIAPASANIIAKMACGIADDILSTTFLASSAQCIIAPAMNDVMWQNQAVQQNITKLKQRGCIFIEPEHGYLACETIAKGRLANITSIVEQTIQSISPKPLSGKTALITLGATIQPIDPFRYISNHSSGKMGYHILQALVNAGAEVTAICANTHNIPPINNAKVIFAQTTDKMSQEFAEHSAGKDIIVMCAAISDYLAQFSDQKIKSESFTLELQKTGDIIKEFAQTKKDTVFVVGFAAESETNKLEIERKLSAKNLDLLVFNKIDDDNPAFNSDYNQVSLIGKNFWLDLPLLPKNEVATQILAKITETMNI